MTASTATIDQANPRFALTINGKVYGPYTAQQMKTYVAEGRVTPGSLISRDNGAWIAASDDPLLASAFTAKADMPAPLPDLLAPPGARPLAPRPSPAGGRAASSLSAREAFLKELEGIKSIKSPVFADPVQPAGPPERRRAPRVEEIEEREEPEAGNFVLIFDVKSRGHGKLEEDIMNMGRSVKILPGIWLLNGPYTAGSIRNQLLHHFGTLDSFFIIDASRDKLAWFNLGPEVDSQIRQVWRRA
jgi:hypothetical protein